MELSQILQFLLLYVTINDYVIAFTKVLVPSVYDEWGAFNETSYEFINSPDWANEPARKKGNYSTFFYQKHNKLAPHYIPFNYGTEAGVYLRYIVDHYNNFPDVALFVHARPESHNSVWEQYFDCVSPNVSYFNINSYHPENYVCRNIPEYFYGPTQQKEPSSIFIEQCARNVLKVVWTLPKLQNESDIESESESHRHAEFHKSFPKQASIDVCLYCCQQFLLSRDQVHRRPLHQWKMLLKLIGEQEHCHVSDLELDELYSSAHFPEILKNETEARFDDGGGRLRGFAMEHLAHVIYGLKGLIQEKETMESICHQFLPRSVCPNSPCLD